MLRIPLLFVATALIGAPSGFGADALKDSFRDPPREYSIEPLWSWNGTLERERLIWQIDQMVEKGVYGAYMHAREGLNNGKTPYFSDGFWAAVKTSVEHASKVGFRAWIYDEDRWPSGDAGGRTRAANPDRFTAQALEHRTREVKGPAVLPLDFPKNSFVIAARKRGAGIDGDSLIDLTAENRAGGRWQIPAGEWIVSVFEITRGRRELPNYINPAMTAEFIRNTYEEYAKRFSQHFGKTIPGSFFDEIYNWWPAWDPILEERFRANKGYDLRKNLPLLYLDAGPRTVKLRCDYFDELTKLYEESWFKQLSAWCARHNLILTGHTNEELRNIRDQGDYFRTWRHPQMPGTDNEDFRYTWPRVVGSWKPKQLSSVAHVYGRRRAMVEALGGAGWTLTLHQARYGINMLAVYGLNSFVIHLFHYSMDTPDTMDDWPNSWFYENPYWKYFKKFADHARRLSFMGSQGSHVADIAVLYPVEQVWSEVLTNPRPEGWPVEKIVDHLMQEHLDCDLVDTDSVVSAVPESGGRARIGKESYRVLVLPDAATVSLKAYARIAKLAAGGLKVIAVGSLPRNSAENGGDDPEVRKISARLFPSGAMDAGKLPAALRTIVAPDVVIDSADAKHLRYLHRRAGARDIYFLANSVDKPVKAQVRFAAKGRAERWDPETGAIQPLAGQQPFELEFAGWQGYYVVFDSSAPPAAGTPQPPERERTLRLDGPWTFQLAPRELDYAWSADPGETRLEVPIADFRVERGASARWRRVKLTDRLNPLKGAARYLSAWDAPWITRYVYRTRHPGQLGGANLEFAHTFEVPFVPEGGWIAIAGEGGLNCTWNGKPLGPAGAARLELTNVPAAQGRNRISCTVKGGYLLAQGEIRGPGGKVVPIATSAEWDVRARDGQPGKAYEFAWPPLGEWGDIPLRGKRVEFPLTVSYRISVPPGARELEPPDIQAARWEVLADGRRLESRAGRFAVPGARELVLRAVLRQPGDGLQRELAFRCVRTAQPLGDWQEHGLDWYSGRAVYGTSFDRPEGKRFVLDLGELCYSGEVWLNGKLAGVLVWPPYRLDISQHLRAGRNELTVVAANLLANQMRWNLFDSAVSRPISRWWHDGNILRDGDKLRSGLIGPVRLLVAE